SSRARRWPGRGRAGRRHGHASGDSRMGPSGPGRELPSSGRSASTAAVWPPSEPRRRPATASRTGSWPSAPREARWWTGVPSWAPRTSGSPEHGRPDLDLDAQRAGKELEARPKPAGLLAVHVEEDLLRSEERRVGK